MGVAFSVRNFPSSRLLLNLRKGEKSTKYVPAIYYFELFPQIMRILRPFLRVSTKMYSRGDTTVRGQKFRNFFKFFFIFLWFFFLNLASSRSPGDASFPCKMASDFTLSHKHKGVSNTLKRVFLETLIFEMISSLEAEPMVRSG